MSFIEKHLNVLRTIDDFEQGPVGVNVLNWVKYVLNDNAFENNELNKRFNRNELFEYCSNKNTEDLNASFAILAWGGMNRKYAQLLYKNWEQLHPIISDLRTGIYQTRQSAYERIQQKRNQKLLPGLGVAYFTKLLCFLATNLNCYIMDQWTSKSINLLVGKKIVQLNGYVWVNDYNDKYTYERFCGYIDELAVELNCTGFEAEKRIYSIGRGKGKWRKYLKECYKNC